MDRNSFLSSLPFLYASTCVSWPPRTELSQDRTSATGRRETLLRDQFVSIELVVDSRNVGPAFFSTNQAPQDLDPAMCKFEMSIYSSKPDTVASTRTITSTLESPSPMTPAIKSSTEQANETVVFFRVDDRVYQVDLGQIQSLDVLHSEESEDATPKPPCLLVRFSTCHFRIFSTSGMVSAEYDQISTLNSTMAHLNLCLSASNAPFPCGNSSLASPTPSSAPSSSTELGQREMYRDADMMPHPHQETPPPATTTTDAKEDAILKTIQRHQRAHAQSQQGLESLQQLLHLPQPPVGEAPSSNLRDHASALLTAVADDYNSSYCSRAQLAQAAQVYDSRIQSYQTRLDDLLTNFFPSSRPAKRSRTTNGSGRSIVPEDKPKPTSSDQVVACASNLMQQHKEAVQGRHALSLLPNRG